MKNTLLGVFVLLFAFGTYSCSKDDDDAGQTVDYSYHAHILKPSSNELNLGDILPIDIIFESHSGEAVHNISVRIYGKDSVVEVFSHQANVNDSSGEYEYEAEFPLSSENGVSGNTAYVLEAKVWGVGAGEGEVAETTEFLVFE